MEREIDGNMEMNEECLALLRSRLDNHERCIVLYKTDYSIQKRWKWVGIIK